LAHTPAFEFLKRRYASAIERADDRTAVRLRAEIDRLINPSAGAGAPAGEIVDATFGGSARAGAVRPRHDPDDILGPHL